MKKLKNNAFLMLLVLVVAGCGGTTLPPNPINALMDKLADEDGYTITLDDMDLNGDEYTHRYKIYTIDQDSKVTISYSPRVVVSEDFFFLHEDDMGMELVSKTPEGVINSLISPPGFTNFIGNDNFGVWNEVYVDTMNVISYDDSTFWKFTGANSNMAEELGIEGLNISLGEYKTFQESYYLNRPFYGPKMAPDSTKYGTRSPHRVRYFPGFYRRRALNRNFYKRYGSSSTGNRGGGGFGK